MKQAFKGHKQRLRLLQGKHKFNDVMENIGSIWRELLYWEDLLICWQFLKESDGSLLICLIWNRLCTRSWKTSLRECGAGEGWVAFTNHVHFSSWWFFCHVSSCSPLHSLAMPPSDPQNPLVWKTLSKLREGRCWSMAWENDWGWKLFCITQAFKSQQKGVFVVVSFFFFFISPYPALQTGLSFVPTTQYAETDL